MRKAGAADQQMRLVGMVDRRQQPHAGQVDRRAQPGGGMAGQGLPLGQRCLRQGKRRRRAIDAKGRAFTQSGDAARAIVELHQAVDHRGDPSRTPSIRRASRCGLSSASAPGSSAAGRFWNATGRRKR